MLRPSVAVLKKDYPASTVGAQEVWLANESMQVAVIWCRERFGVNGMSYRTLNGGSLASDWHYSPEARWCLWGGSFWFKTEADALHFKMRWAG